MFVQSSREVWDILRGDDAALPVIEAIRSSDDHTKLQNLLSQPEWVEIAFEEPECIYSEDRPRHDENDVRNVSAMPLPTLTRAIIIAGALGRTAAVTDLLGFASQQGRDLQSVLVRYSISLPIKNGHAAVIAAIGAAYPAVINYPLGHDGPLPIDLAMERYQFEVVAVLLELGADPDGRSGSFFSSLLSLATRTGTRMVDLLIRHGATIDGSGALHSAANSGRTATMRYLIEHGADVDEILPAERLPRCDNALYATFTPMHFAARKGQEEAMELLQSYGARADVRDIDGKTAAQLLEEHKAEHKS